jgi:hypothetical protein
LEVSKRLTNLQIKIMNDYYFKTGKLGQKNTKNESEKKIKYSSDPS